MAKKKNKANRGGRKPVQPSEKMVLVGFYVKQWMIDLLGGKDKTREMAKNSIEVAAINEDTGRYAAHCGG